MKAGAPLAVGAALAVALAVPAARADPPPSVATRPEELHPGAPRSRTYPLVLLVQADAVFASEPDSVPAPSGDDPPFGSALRVRRVRAGDDVRGNTWQLRWLLEAQSRDQPYAPIEGNRIPVGRLARVPEAFGAWVPNRALQISVGALRVPVSLSRQVDEADLRLPERPQIITALAPDFRVGVAFTSDLGLLHLRIAGMSADRSLDRNLFASGTFGAVRLDAEPIGPMGVAPWRRRADDPWYDWWRFSAGVSFLYGTLFGPHTIVVGGDAQLQWLRFTVTGEALAQYDRDGENAGAWPRLGAVVEPGYYLWSERLEVVLRGAWYRRPNELTAPVDDRTDTLAAGGGLTLYTHAAHLRLQAAFELRRTAQDLRPDSSWALLRATLTTL